MARSYSTQNPREYRARNYRQDLSPVVTTNEPRRAELRNSPARFSVPEELAGYEDTSFRPLPKQATLRLPKAQK